MQRTSAGQSITLLALTGGLMVGAAFKQSFDVSSTMVQDIAADEKMLSAYDTALARHTQRIESALSSCTGADITALSAYHTSAVRVRSDIDAYFRSPRGNPEPVLAVVTTTRIAEDSLQAMLEAACPRPVYTAEQP